MGGELGIKLVHVPYKGLAPALNDIMAGHVQMMFGDFATALPLIQAGKLRALGVSTAQRVGAAPEIPALAEVGLKDFDASSWQMMIAPGKIPPDILNRLNAEIRAIVAEPAVQKEFSQPRPDPARRRHAGGTAGLCQIRDRALGRRGQARRRRASQ